MKVATIGLDIAKHIFQVHAADAEGRPLLRRRLRRSRVARFFASLPPCLAGMDACPQFPRPGSYDTLSPCCPYFARRSGGNGAGRNQPAVAGDPLIRHQLGYLHLSRCSTRASFGVSSHPVES
jgi:hypothetical protein